MTQRDTTDVRLVPIAHEHIDLIKRGTRDEILEAVAYIVQAYDTAPPMTHISALAYMRDIQWWRNQTQDLDAA